MTPSGPHSAVSRQDLQRGFSDLGIKRGFRLIVHSSLSRFGHVAGGAALVIETLREAVGPDGWLLMPSFNHGAPFESGGSGYYDPGETPTTNGIIPETFRLRADVRRSLNPTHPVAAWGPEAVHLTQGHHRTLTMGPESPLGLLGRRGGWGLLLGVGFSSNTYHHVVEMTGGAPCLGRRTECYPVRLPSGRLVEGRTWGWRDGRCPFTGPNGYAVLLEQKGLVRSEKIGQADVRLFRLADCFDTLSDLHKHGGLGHPPCSGCPVRPRTTAETVPSDWDEDTQALRPDSSSRLY